MYGGYGNLWNQASAQWQTGNLPVQNQNQMPGNSAAAAVTTAMGSTGTVQQSYQNQQQAGMQLGNAAASMANYANLGMQSGNPYMNYANPAMGNMGMGYNQNAMANAWGSNNANLQFQQQVYMQSQNLLAFPGGRPPLPPGPPPPDKPKEVKPASQTPAAQAPPPPPPPQPSSIENSGFGIGAAMLPNILKPEDAYNIIKSAAALGLIPGNGALAPLTALNVSEELFGSKNTGQGIPGLDGGEDLLAARKTPEPEVIDLEKDPAGLKKDAQEIKGKNDLKPISQSKTENDNPWVIAADKQAHENKSSLPKKTDKEVVWELRPDVKNNDWTLPPGQASSTGAEINNGNQQGKREIQSSQTVSSETKSSVPFTKGNPGENKPKAEEPKVRIPLEPTDGQPIVYDKRTLKQFDQKFREWENQFEKWKRDNENHPNQTNYLQYLDQWNLWREQLVEQRRCILDTMNKARMNGNQILFSNLESSNAEDEKFSDPKPTTSSINKSKPEPEDTLWNQKDSTNPFQMASNFETVTPTSTMASGNSNEKAVKDERSSTNAERVLRQGSGGAGNSERERNIFGDSFKNEQRQEKNPFLEQESEAFEREICFGNSNNSNPASKCLPKKEIEEAALPFEWSLPSQKPQDKNPFNMSNSQSMNPFMQPTGPNPFDMGPQQKLPSLLDFINRTNLDFPMQQPKSSNPFMMESGESAGKTQSRSEGQHSQVERISRDPQGNQSKTNIIITPPSTIRLEANPVGMPLLRAAAIQEDEQIPDEEEENDEFSNLFSRDRGPAADEDSSNNVQFDDEDFVEDAEVIDYGANSMDDMDFPRGEKAAANDANDEDFSLEDSEVIDYSESAYPEHDEFYEGDYPPGYEYEYPPFFPVGMRGMRGRGRGGYPHPRGRGPFHGPVPFGHPYYGRMPPPQFGPGYGPGPMPRGRGRYPPGHPNWYQHDERVAPPIGVEGVDESPEIVVLSPSPEPSAARVKIAPPEFDAERERARRRSVSGDRDRRRHSKDRTRSRSRDRVERVSRRREDSSSDKRGRRGDSPYGSKRDKERDRSPDVRRRQDDRRDKYRSGRGRRSTSKSRSRSPPRRDSAVLRNPLFPSAAGMTASNQASASNPASTRYQTILIEDILNKPSRTKRPQRIVIIMRGLPGSGKSHIVKLIKEREVEMGGKAPRILSLDNYFITEIEKKEKDPVTGVDVKTTVMEYEYDEEREPLYRAQLVRQFKKTIDDGYFGFVVVDGVNEYVRQFEEMATFATQKRFQVYVAEIEESIDVCVKRNTHKRTKDQLLKIQRRWEKTPGNFIKLDTRALLQVEAVDDDVEMEDVSDVETDANTDKPKTPSPTTLAAPTPAERGKIGPQVVGVEDIEDEDSGDHLLTSAISSKWDTMEQSQEKLNKLDGLAKRRKNNPENSEPEAATSIEMWLTGNLPEDYGHRTQTVPGQKRVRWADIEERREQEKMREMGFVVGHTDWNRMMDPTFGGSALTKTKFI